MPKQKLIVLVGFPASGKTTWARDYVEKDTKAVRVSSDDLITMFTGHRYSPQVQAELVRPLEDWIVMNALMAGYSVLIDRTNLTRRERERWIEVGQNHRAAFGDLEINCLYCDEKEEVWRARNEARGEKAVPELAIRKMIERFEDPRGEPFDFLIGRTTLQ